MSLLKLLDRWSSTPVSENHPVLSYLHSSDHFQTILECERMRSDRSGNKFALAVFTVKPGSETVEFARTLQRRLRATDHAGFLSATEIGVILWDTEEKGAWEFISALRQQHSPENLPPFQIYVYPTHHPTNSTDSSSKETQVFDPVSDLLGEQTARPLEELFVKPLPAWKRGVDIVGAVVGLIVLSPLLLLTALLVKFTSPGPVLFRQKRDGLGGKPFMIFKFRTMYIDAEARQAELRKQSEQDGPAFKLKNDPRITPPGKFLRKTCIDELPQLWNVLIGDMTLVGPRPLDSRESQQISGWGRRRLEVTPGLTCIWQVHGKSRVTFSEWMRMDLRYIGARTFFHDAKLVLHTLLQIVQRKASH